MPKIRRLPSLLVLASALLASRSSFAEGNDGRVASQRIETDAKSYCAWVRAAAASESAPMVAPALFVGGGIVGGPDAGDGASSLPPTKRITAGASYSVSGLLRGLATSDRADADCELYRQEAVIRAFVQAYRDGESKSALEASLAVYRAAEPKAAEMFERIRAAASAGRATTVELTEAELRLDDLRTRFARNRAQLDALEKKSVPSPKDLAQALASRPAREADVEREAARIRRSTAWDLGVRGGYDRFFGVRDHVPLFATATLTINLGVLFQFGPDHRAIESREEWAKNEIEGPIDRAAQVKARLSALRTEAKSRLEATTVLSTNLEQRLGGLEAINTDAARVAANTVWFALVHAKADRSFYAALMSELDTALGGGA
jgi:hypothetical protein